MQIHESAENYLERILMLSEEKGMVRSVDIAQELSVTKPSVSIAMKNLREDGYILMDKDSLITLTDKGMATAREDACKIEHDISPATFQAICRALQETP